MTIFFFNAIALNEGPQIINAMSDYMEKFNRIGYQISQVVSVTSESNNLGKTLQKTLEQTGFKLEIHAH
jgi:hypothetical protein